MNRKPQNPFTTTVVSIGRLRKKKKAFSTFTQFYFFPKAAHAQQPDARCNARSEAGHCRLTEEKYFFDKEKNQCTPKSLGDCGGDEDLFDSLAECTNTCLRNRHWIGSDLVLNCYPEILSINFRIKLNANRIVLLTFSSIIICLEIFVILKSGINLSEYLLFWHFTEFGMNLVRLSCAFFIRMTELSVIIDPRSMKKFGMTDKCLSLFSKIAASKVECFDFKSPNQMKTDTPMGLLCLLVLFSLAWF